MKKVLAAINFLLLLIFVVNCFAAGTVTQTTPNALFDTSQRFGVMGPDPKYMVTVTLTADATAHTYPTFQINGTCSSAAPTASPSCTVPNVLLGWYLYKVEAWPGTTAPTNGWAATVKDSFGTGYDFCAGKIIGSSTVNTVADCYPSGQNYMPVNGPLTVATTGNSEDSAVIYMIFYFLPK